MPRHASKIKLYASKEGPLGIGIKGVILGVGNVVDPQRSRPLLGQPIHHLCIEHAETAATAIDTWIRVGVSLGSRVVKRTVLAGAITPAQAVRQRIGGMVHTQ